MKAALLIYNKDDVVVLCTIQTSHRFKEDVWCFDKDDVTGSDVMLAHLLFNYLLINHREV